MIKKGTYLTRVICILLLLIFIGSPLYINAQLNYQFDRINTENGLPTNSIKGLQFDEKNRFLWIATESGIVRYNGHSFQSFGDNAITSKLNGRTNIFTVRADGNLFGKLVDASVFKIQQNKAVCDSSGFILKTSYEYLNYKYQLAPIKHDAKLYSEITHDFKVNGRIYLPVEFHLLRYERSHFDTVLQIDKLEQFFTLQNRIFLLQNSGKVVEVVTDASGKLYKKNILNVEPPFSGHYFNSDQIKLFQNKSNDSVYVINERVLYSIRLNGDKIQFNAITNQLPNKEYIKYLQIDRYTQTIYLGTDNRGVLVGRPSYFNRHLPINTVFGSSSSSYAQVMLPNGNIQINSGQVFGNAKREVSKVIDLPSSTSTYTTKSGLFLYSNTKGLFEYNLLTRQRVCASNDIFYYGTTFIELDSTIYAFGASGIARRNKYNKWSILLRFTKKPVDFIIFSLMQLKKNIILVATTDGLYKYDIVQNKFSLFYRDKTGANFRTIYKLDDSYLLGTYGAGIFIYKNDTIKALPLDKTEYLKFSHCFVEDAQNNIWISTNKGVFMTNKLALINAWNINKDHFSYKYFGKQEGIDVLELNGGCTPCALVLPNGVISFPGIDGLVQFNPSFLPSYKINPFIFIDKLIINKKEKEVSYLNEVFPSNTKLIEIELGISGMLSEENIIIEYNIDDDKLWRSIDIKNPILKFEKPNYGQQHFNIRWRNTIDEVWNIQTYNLNLRYPWYLHPYMFFAYALICFLLVSGYIKRRTIIYQRRQKSLEQEVTIKTKSLKRINEYLLQRNRAKDHVIAIMNHDVLTPLKYLHISAKEIAHKISDEHLKKSISQFATTTKELEYLTSNMLNWVKFDNIDKLPNKQEVDLNKMFSMLIDFIKPFQQNESVKIVNAIKQNTIIYNWPDSLRVLLYNILMNSVKSTHKGTIMIEFEQYKKDYKIIIRDTGEGMSESMAQYLTTGLSKDQVEQLPKYKNGNGVGYQIIRHIITLMKAELKIESNEGEGAVVIIKFKM